MGGSSGGRIDRPSEFISPTVGHDPRAGRLMDDYRDWPLQNNRHALVHAGRADCRQGVAIRESKHLYTTDQCCWMAKNRRVDVTY